MDQVPQLKTERCEHCRMLTTPEDGQEFDEAMLIQDEIVDSFTGYWLCNKCIEIAKKV